MTWTEPICRYHVYRRLHFCFIPASIDHRSAIPSINRYWKVYYRWRESRKINNGSNLTMGNSEFYGVLKTRKLAGWRHRWRLSVFGWKRILHSTPILLCRPRYQKRTLWNTYSANGNSEFKVAKSNSDYISLKYRYDQHVDGTENVAHAYLMTRSWGSPLSDCEWSGPMRGALILASRPPKYVLFWEWEHSILNYSLFLQRIQ